VLLGSSSCVDVLRKLWLARCCLPCYSVVRADRCCPTCLRRPSGSDLCSGRSATTGSARWFQRLPWARNDAHPLEPISGLRSAPTWPSLALGNRWRHCVASSC